MNTSAPRDSGGPSPPCCPFCGAAAPLRRRVPSPYLSPRVDYAIHGCRDCGHHFALGPHDEATLARVYSRAYHATTQQHAAGPDSPVAVNARDRARRLAAAGLGGRLLDIGAGRGHFVRAAREYFDAEGLEYSASAAAAARAEGLPVATGAFPAAAPAGPFAVVTLWDVLDGFPDVHAAVQAIATLLAPGGRLTFTVPLVSSRCARWLGRWWPLWIPPDNLHYFTPESVARLLGAHGLRVLSVAPEGKRVTVDFLIRKALRTVRLSALEGVAGVVPRSWSITLNLGDIATVHAEKPVEAAP